jgi:two-component sensor histidine kinase
MIGENFWQVVLPEDRHSAREMLERLTPDAPAARIENRVMTKDGERWFLWTNRALDFDEQGRCIEIQSTGIDITERKVAENHRQLLIDELNHRVKNTLAVVQGIAQRTFTKDASPVEARTAFYGRLSALGAAHGLLAQQSWERVDLDELVRSVFEAAGAASARSLVAGPSVLLEPRHALAIAMALHELSTNAMKYGALSQPAGNVEVSWKVIEGSRPELALEWRERGGPPVAPPARRGFGLMMIERVLASEAGCSVQLDFLGDGVRCKIGVMLNRKPAVRAEV